MFVCLFVCMFFCLFVGLFVLFCLNHRGTPSGTFPESFVMIVLDLAEIWSI